MTQVTKANVELKEMAADEVEFDASNYTPSFSSSTTSVTASEDDVVTEEEAEMYENLCAVLNQFSEDNDVDVSIGKMSKGSTRRIVVGLTQKVTDLPEGCDTAGYNSFMETDSKMKAQEAADKVEVLGLIGRGINIGDKITVFTSIKPKSRTKKLTTAMLIGGKPNGKTNKLTIREDGSDREKPMSVEEFLQLKNNPLTSADLAVENGDARWREATVFEEDGVTPKIDENGDVVKTRKLVKVIKAN